MVMGGEIDLDKLRQSRRDWTILYTGINRTSVDGDIVGLVEAALQLVNEHDIKPQDVSQVVVKGNTHQVKYQGDPTDPRVRLPQTREDAVHSIFYATAVAIADRAMGFEQFLEERFETLDPAVQELMDKITVEADPKYSGLNQSGSAAITTHSGRKYSCEVLYPKGIHPKNPMTHEEHEENFRSMAGRVIDEQQIRRIIAAVYDLDKLGDITELVSTMVIPNKN